MLRSLLLLALLLLLGCGGQYATYERDDDDATADDDGDDDDSAADDDDAAGDDASPDDGSPDDDDAADDPECFTEGATACWSADHMQCKSGAWVLLDSCAGDTPTCEPDLGCILCEPNTRQCDGDTVVRCSSAGDAWQDYEWCDDGICLNGVCY